MNGFWKWYLEGLEEIVSFKWLSSEPGEALVGAVIFVAGMILAIALSAWFLLLVLVGATLAAHGYWRQFRKGG